MAVQGPIPVDFAQAFPRGAYAVGEFEPVRDFEASKGLPGGLLWAVPGSNQFQQGSTGLGSRDIRRLVILGPVQS